MACGRQAVAVRCRTAASWSPLPTTRARLNVHIVDPSAYAPPYDHELCTALARAGASVELHTSRFAYGPVPANAEYRSCRTFYRWQPATRRPRVRRFAKLAQHGPDMLAYRRR